MYFFIKKIENILHYEFHNKDLITVLGDQNEAYLTLINNDLDFKDKIQESTAYDFIKFEDSLIFTSKKASESYHLKVEDKFKNLEKLNYILHIKGANFKNNYLCYGELNNSEYFLLIDLKNRQVLKQIPVSFAFDNFDDYIDDNLVLSTKRKQGKIGVFTLENQQLWEHLVSDILTSEKKGEIKEVKVYKNNIIVLSTAGVISFDIISGKINWSTVTYAVTIEIVDDIGYVCTSVSLFRINLDDGLILEYEGWVNSRMPDFIFKEKTYWPAGYRVVYHDGLLWYAVYDSGESFIIGINPYNGIYEWVLPVETNEKINSIKFNQNCMYILDYGNDLHVYKKLNNHI